MDNVMQTEPFCAGGLDKARVLVIGHDPRLQASDTQAECAFFADYFFGPRPSRSNETAKYRLAEATFSYIGQLTSNRYPADQLVLTNLCNVGLPHAPTGKTVLIPAQEAQIGIKAIHSILHQSPVEIIFAMSAQVNYWLQKLGFYPPVAEFLSKAEPKPEGLSSKPPYYVPQQGKAFQLICGQCYTAGRRIVVPILHVKHWPLGGAFATAYSQAYEDCVNRLNGA
jgi:hypothetical protein